jgi:molybdate transport system substrate-binding protein
MKISARNILAGKITAIKKGRCARSCFPASPHAIKMKPRHIVIAGLAAFLAASASATGLTVFAAASLSDSLKEIAPVYAKATGDTVRFNFGASGTLARQIKEGAPADVFVSADELRVDQLEKAGLLLPGTRKTILANQLVVIVAAANGAPVASLADLKKVDVRRIAIGEPATVPVGTYTKEHLEKLGLWTQVSGKCVPLDNVRAVLAAVESGNADVGFVYKTDALSVPANPPDAIGRARPPGAPRPADGQAISTKVRIATLVPLAEGPRITYPVAVMRDTKAPEAAKAFAVFLAGPDAQKVFAKFGFLPPN